MRTRLPSLLRRTTVQARSSTWSLTPSRSASSMITAMVASRQAK